MRWRPPLAVRSSVRAVAALAACAVLAAGDARAGRPRRAAAPPPLQPNIVVILTDDQHPASLPYMSQVSLRLAAEGIAFSNAFVPTPICGPSRASLFTGQYAHRSGIVTNVWSASIFLDRVDSLPVWLQDAGYQTALVGKYLNDYHLAAPARAQGWDVWRVFPQGAPFFDYDLVFEDGSVVHYGTDESDYVTDVLLGHALDFIRQSAGGPFFLLFSTSAPHAPSTPAPRHAGLLAAEPPWRPASHHEPDTSDKPPVIRFQQMIFDPANLAVRDQQRLDQLESLMAVDEAVGAILDELEALGLRDDTLVVFTTDNGYGWGEHWWYWKEVPIEESLRVPLIVSHPALAPRVEDRMVVMNLDLPATIVELAGATPTLPLDGRSLWRMLLDLPTGPWRDDFLIEYFSGFWVDRVTGVRTADDWKFVRWDDLDPPFRELYDLASDPLELDNLMRTDPGDPLVQNKAAELEARADALASQ